MIIGLGNDIVDIRRIEKALARFGTKFEQRVFTDAEQGKSNRRLSAGERIRAATYAKRFAAKEACAKALGTGVPRRGVHWRGMGVINLPSGKPTMELSGGALMRLREITPQGKTAQIDVTLTDDYPLAQAIVIITAV
ncbi:MAG: holo-ACP synthase [Alphaproteobacteria bacterium]|nr:holo-ACP synthase [Alphaproteobacteria bacterium]